MGSIQRHEADVFEQRIHRPDEGYTVLEGCKKIPRHLFLLLGATLECLSKSHHMNQAHVVVFFHPGTEPVRLRELPHDKWNARDRGPVIFPHDQIVLLDRYRRGGETPIKQGQLEGHRQVGVVRSFCKKRNVANFIADRIDQPDMPPSWSHNRKCRQLRRVILQVDFAVLKNKREDALRAKSSSRYNVFVFVNGFAKRLAPRLRLFSPKGRNPRRGENKIHANRLDSPVLE